jgi:hypothetical protein
MVNSNESLRSLETFEIHKMDKLAGVQDVKGLLITT